MSLSFSEAYGLQEKILQGGVSDTDLIEIFIKLDRPLEFDEFRGLYQASADAMMRISTVGDVLDTCGTGGDGLHTFNISTASAILCAALGVPVAKHGNRSASSQCGSADVLQELGVDLHLKPDQVAECINTTGFGFMYAPTFHPAFKHASAARKAFGRRTYFNFLGPLLNPAQADFRLIGVSDTSMIDIMGRTLLASGVTRAWLVHSDDGMDEISTSGKTVVVEFTQQGGSRTFIVDPVEYGLDTYSTTELIGGSARVNAGIIKDVLQGRGTPAQTTAVVLNTAAGLCVAGSYRDYTDAIAAATLGISGGLGYKKLLDIVSFAGSVSS